MEVIMLFPGHTKEKVNWFINKEKKQDLKVTEITIGLHNRSDIKNWESHKDIASNL